MKFYPKLCEKMGREIVEALVVNKSIELAEGMQAEAQEDFAAILREWQRQADEIGSDASALLERREWPRSKFAEARDLIAAQRKFAVREDEAIDYLIAQMLEFMMMSSHIEEVFAADNVLRKAIVTVLRRYAKIDEEIDQEVRARLKHLEEGGSDWEIQYRQIAEQVKRNKGLL